MSKFESKQSQPKLDTNEGWLVQVYGGNRRLLCVLEPSHGWIFLIGFSVGLLLSFFLMNAVRHSPSLETNTPTHSPMLEVD